MRMVADCGFTPERVEEIRKIYRRVGRRDAGWEFNPSKVPLILMPDLVQLYVEYLRESEANAAEITAAIELHDVMLEKLDVEPLEEAA